MTKCELNEKFLKACGKSNLCLAKELLLNGADINYVNSKNESALHFACQAHNYDLVKLLLESGIDKNIRSNDHVTAVYYVSIPTNKYKDIEYLINSYKEGDNEFIYEAKTEVKIIIPKGYELKEKEPREPKNGEEIMLCSALENFSNLFSQVGIYSNDNCCVFNHPILGTKRFIVQKIKSELELAKEEYLINLERYNNNRASHNNGNIALKSAYNYIKLLEHK